MENSTLFFHAPLFLTVTIQSSSNFRSKFGGTLKENFPGIFNGFPNCLQFSEKYHNKISFVFF